NLDNRFFVLAFLGFAVSNSELVVRSPLVEGQVRFVFLLLGVFLPAFLGWRRFLADRTLCGEPHGANGQRGDAEQHDDLVEARSPANKERRTTQTQIHEANQTLQGSALAPDSSSDLLVCVLKHLRRPLRLAVSN